MYEFSIPMPFHPLGIDFISVLNKTLKKSKITSIYFALPATDEDCTGFEQNRTGLNVKTNFSYWKPILIKARELHIDTIYLLNSPKPINTDRKTLNLQLNKLDKLISNLKSAGCTTIRVSNIQLLNYLLKEYPELTYYASTSFEFTQFKQYKNFIETFPQIKQIVPSFNINKDFKQLKNLRTQFPNTEIELMVNEGCIAGCPFRNEHNNSLPTFYEEDKIQINSSFALDFYVNKCNKISEYDIHKYICTSNIIHPWEIEEYEKIGINKFKLVGRNSTTFIKGQYLEIYKNYLKGIDDYKNIENIDYKILNHYIHCKNFEGKIKDIKPFLPNIKHFIKKGHLCSSICGNECNYCFECAEKLKKALENK